MQFKKVGWNALFILKEEVGAYKSRGVPVYRKLGASPEGNARRESDFEMITVDDDTKVISLSK